jgi:hypothetical protein
MDKIEKNVDFVLDEYDEAESEDIHYTTNDDQAIFVWIRFWMDQIQSLEK